MLAALVVGDPVRERRLVERGDYPREERVVPGPKHLDPRANRLKLVHREPRPRVPLRSLRLGRVEQFLVPRGLREHRLELRGESLSRRVAREQPRDPSPQRRKQSRGTQRAKIRPGGTLRPRSHRRDRPIRRLRPPLAGVQSQNFAPRRRARERKVKLTVEPARPSQRGIHRVRAVRGRDHHHAAPRAQAVHEREQGGDDGAVDLIVRVAASPARLPRRRQSVNLVKENDARLPSLSLLEKQAKRSLRLAHVLAEAVRPLAVKERDRARATSRGAEERSNRRRLTRPRRTVK